MDYRKLEEGIIDNALEYGKKYNLEIDEDFALIKLYEEVGEYAQAVLIHRKKCRPEKFVDEAVSKKEMAMELADVVGMAVVNAHAQGIDLLAALQEKWLKNK